MVHWLYTGDFKHCDRDEDTSTITTICNLQCFASLLTLVCLGFAFRQGLEPQATIRSAVMQSTIVATVHLTANGKCLSKSPTACFAAKILLTPC